MPLTSSKILRQRLSGRRKRQGGSALIEFLLASIFLIFPLLLGTFVFGMSLVRANQVSEVCRDAAHMWAYGVPFQQPGAQSMLVQLAHGLNMTTTGGNGVVILSTVTYIDASACPARNCANLNNTVFLKRIVIGNPTLHTSAFGTPSSVDSSGNVNNYLNDTTARALDFSNVISIMTSSQYAYMAETFVASPDFNFWKGNTYWRWLRPGVISSRSIF